MAIGDFIMLLFLPLNVHRLRNEDKWKFGTTACGLYNSVSFDRPYLMTHIGYFFTECTFFYTTGLYLDAAHNNVRLYLFAYSVIIRAIFNDDKQLHYKNGQKIPTKEPLSIWRNCFYTSYHNMT